ncbi:unnamed protein product [Linum trigynum]|uniref:Uncharacterized protein n=1 Tax=Linum trigynum TaxID=586398 RepID=A0AAV2FVT3_9ROSI
MKQVGCERTLPRLPIVSGPTSNDGGKAMGMRSLEFDHLLKERPNSAAELAMTEEMVTGFLSLVAQDAYARKIPSISFQVLVCYDKFVHEKPKERIHLCWNIRAPHHLMRKVVDTG